MFFEELNDKKQINLCLQYQMGCKQVATKPLTGLTLEQTSYP